MKSTDPVPSDNLEKGWQFGLFDLLLTALGISLAIILIRTPAIQLAPEVRLHPQGFGVLLFIAVMAIAMVRMVPRRFAHYLRWGCAILFGLLLAGFIAGFVFFVARGR